MLKKKSIFEGGGIPHKSQLRKPSLKERGKALKGALWGLFAPVFVLGGIYAGIFTASEAAAVMVLYAILVTVVFMKTLTLKKTVALRTERCGNQFNDSSDYRRGAHFCCRNVSTEDCCGLGELRQYHRLVTLCHVGLCFIAAFHIRHPSW